LRDLLDSLFCPVSSSLLSSSYLTALFVFFSILYVRPAVSDPSPFSTSDKCGALETPLLRFSLQVFVYAALFSWPCFYFIRVQIPSPIFPPHPKLFLALFFLINGRARGAAVFFFWVPFFFGRLLVFHWTHCPVWPYPARVSFFPFLSDWSDPRGGFEVVLFDSSPPRPFFFSQRYPRVTLHIASPASARLSDGVPRCSRQ